jgi:hypothetical protein
MIAADLRALIKSTLTPLGLYSANAEELLMATCANESNLGEYRTQVGGGPARGIFQMEGEDFNDIWYNWLGYKTGLAFSIAALNGGQRGTVDDLVANDPYSIAMARCHYARCPGALPIASDLNGIWSYYKRYYNTPIGAANQSVFISKYRQYVLGAN